MPDIVTVLSEVYGVFFLCQNDVMVAAPEGDFEWVLRVAGTDCQAKDDFLQIGMTDGVYSFCKAVLRYWRRGWQRRGRLRDDIRRLLRGKTMDLRMEGVILGWRVCGEVTLELCHRQTIWSRMRNEAKTMRGICQGRVLLRYHRRLKSAHVWMRNMGVRILARSLQRIGWIWGQYWWQ